MLGWHITVYRQQGGGAEPAMFDTEEGDRLAVWQTGLGGLRWLDELVEQGHAVDLGGNGYPMRYTAIAKHVVARLEGEPPESRPRWTLPLESGPPLPQWLGRTTKYPEVIAACLPDEWLLIQAWDES